MKSNNETTDMCCRDDGVGRVGKRGWGLGCMTGAAAAVKS